MTRKVFLILLAVLLTLSVGLVACGGAGEQEEEEEEEEEEPIDIAEQIDMEGAINVVVEDVLPNLPEVQAGDSYQCIKLDSSLPEGTIIEEDSGSTLRITLGVEMFFFYLDLVPGALYEHAVKYILVDENGNHEEYDARWWPLIDGEIPEELVADVPDEADVIASNIEFGVDEPVPLVLRFPILPLGECEGFIVVQGLRPYEMCYFSAIDDATNQYDFFTEYCQKQAEGCSRLVNLGHSNALNIFDTIDNMVAMGYNPITISIIAHGSADWIRLDGQKVLKQWFRNKMVAHQYTTFNLIMNSSHGGTIIDDLETLDNVCVVATACGADQHVRSDRDYVAFGFGFEWDDYNPWDSGLEWSSSLLEAMSVILEDEVKFGVVMSLAASYDIPVTSALIWMGFVGAVGDNPDFGLEQDLDLWHRIDFEHPQIYTSWPT